MPTLFLLCGLPFSGKTTLGQQLAEKTGGILVAYDALWHEQKEKTGREWSFEQLCALAETRLLDALHSGHDAIFDTLNDAEGWRAHLKTLWPDVQIVFLDTPLDVIQARRAENSRTLARHEVSDEAFEASLKKFEPPTNKESPLAALRSEDEIATWLGYGANISLAAGNVAAG